MVKYRRLNQEELKELEQDFVHFLSAQSITADDWISIKETDESRMNELIDQFSDIVLEKALSNISYLEMLSEKEMRIFKMDDSKARLVGLKAATSSLDLRREEDLELLFKEIDVMKKQNIELFQLNKEYTKPKADEVFFLIQNGALISDNKLYDILDSLIK